MEILVHRARIAREVRRLAGEISRDYAGIEPLLVGVLHGSFIFMADLARALSIPVSVDFIKASSYLHTVSSGRVEVTDIDRLDVRGRHVVLVEDIVDTGKTATQLIRAVEMEHPNSLKLCTLLDKPSRRALEVPIDYVGFEIPDKFVVGYGLDLDGRFRQLPDVYTID